MSTPSVIGRLVEALPPPDQPTSPRRDVADEQVLSVLEAARIAPSADNLQIWRFVVVRSPERRARLADAVSAQLSRSVAEASVVLVVCGVRGVVARARREQPFVFIDVPIALTHILLRATEAGVPCAWTLEVDQSPCRAELGIPRQAQVIAVVALG